MARNLKPERATIDFETRSEVDLRKHGTHRYATHPTTDVLVMAYRLPHWRMGRTEIWHPAYPELGITAQGGDWDALFELFEWIHGGGIVEAHNAWFERNIWRFIMVERYGWPSIPNIAWRCSAAQAAAVALPRGLDDALAAMRLAITKDGTGYKVMMKMTKPRKARKAERELWREEHGNDDIQTLWHEDYHLLDQLFRYVRQDVLAEEALSYAIPDLSPDELEMYWLDQTLNDRGFQLDVAAFKRALVLLQEEAAELNAELSELTDEQVTKASQRAKLSTWLMLEGLELDNTAAATLDEILAIEDWSRDERTRTASRKAKRAVEILRLLGRSSTGKYEAMKRWADLTTGRVHGGLLYHGASTGRWTGVGIQPQNFPKGTLKAPEGESANAFVARLWNDIKRSDRKTLRALYGKSILEILAHALRSAIVAAPGKELFVADYASIEARVVLWLAGDEDALEVFRSGADIYLYTAEGIYKRPLTKADTTERQMGKQAVLGLGYQMGASKFVDTLAKYGIVIKEDHYCEVCGLPSKKHRKMDRDHLFEPDGDGITAVQVVDAYREKYWRTKQLWEDQEAAAIKATQTGRRVVAGKVTWFVEGSFLYCELPSGRRLGYAFPKVQEVTTAWGAQKMSLTFMGVNPKTRQWQRQTTYGGMIVENITQAVSRDLIALALLRLEKHPVYEPVLSVHDEAVAEAEIGKGNVAEFEHLVSELPDWAEGLPVAAEAWSGLRYRK